MPDEPLNYESPKRPQWWQYDRGSVILICINTIAGLSTWLGLSQVNDNGFAPIFCAIIAIISGICGFVFGVIGLAYTFIFADDGDTSRVRTLLLGMASLIALSPWLVALYALCVSAAWRR